MKKETVTWYSFPKKIPREMRGAFTKVMIDRGKGGEFAMLDDMNLNRQMVFLDCNGVHGGTLVENLNDIKFIAFRPIAPIEMEKREEEKRRKKEKELSEKTP